MSLRQLARNVIGVAKQSRKAPASLQGCNSCFSGCARNTSALQEITYFACVERFARIFTQAFFAAATFPGSL
jgi:hypothetical protein